MSDPKNPGAGDLSWLPKLNAEEWRLALEDLFGLRLMLAGLGFRYAFDASRAPVNQALAVDISAIQAQLQQLIDRSSANEAATHDLAKSYGAAVEQPAGSEVQQVAVPGKSLMVSADVFDKLRSARRKWDAALAQLMELLLDMQKVAIAHNNEELAREIEQLSAAGQQVAATVREVRFLAQVLDQSEFDATTAGIVH